MLGKLKTTSKRIKMYPGLPDTKIILKQYKDLKMRSEVIKLEENIINKQIHDAEA